MNKTKLSLRSSNMAITSKNKKKVVSCSTPEHQNSESPSRDSESDAGSPVPFLCTQDGGDGETDVVWNYYTPKSGHSSATSIKNSTPLSTKPKRSTRPKITEKQLPRRNKPRVVPKNTQLLQDLLELNQNLHKFIDNKSKNSKTQSESGPSESEEDIFSNSLDCSPKSGLRSNSRSLRKNLLSSKFNKPEPESEGALESDDSMNECLVTASQMIEEKLLKGETTPARTKQEKVKPVSILHMDQDSMDAILNSINFESPIPNKVKKVESPHLENDSFDNFLGNLNDSALDRLSQMPLKTVSPNRLNGSQWIIKEVKFHDNATTSPFGRHSSMPESPRIDDVCKPSTSGTSLGRHSSLPHDNQDELGDTSPIRCTPDEIKRKHKQAREKLLAKRLLPFTTNLHNKDKEPEKSTQSQNVRAKRNIFQPKVANSSPITRVQSLPARVQDSIEESNNQNCDKSLDLRQLIEKKRQEAIMKLRKRQPQK